MRKKVRITLKLPDDVRRTAVLLRHELSGCQDTPMNRLRLENVPDTWNDWYTWIRTPEDARDQLMESWEGKAVEVSLDTENPFWSEAREKTIERAKNMSPERAWKLIWEAGLHTKEEAWKRARMLWRRKDLQGWIKWKEIGDTVADEKQGAEKHLRRITGVPHEEQLSWIMGDYHTEVVADRHLSFIWRDIVLAKVPIPVVIGVLSTAQGRSNVPAAWLGPQGAVDHELHRIGLGIGKRRWKYELARAREGKESGDGEGISAVVGICRYSIWDFVDGEKEWKNFGCLTEVIGLRRSVFCGAEYLIPLLRGLPEGCGSDLFWEKMETISRELKR